MADLAVSLGIGILAGLGVGSGGLLILFLTSVAGLDRLAAQGVNLAVFVFALTAAMGLHARRRLPRAAGVILLAGAVGAAGGAALAPRVDTELLRTGLGVLTVVMGGVALIRGGQALGGKRKKENFSARRT